MPVFLITHFYETLKFSQMEDFKQINNPSPYSTLSHFYPPILAITGVKTRHCPWFSSAGPAFVGVNTGHEIMVENIFDLC